MSLPEKGSESVVVTALDVRFDRFTTGSATDSLDSREGCAPDRTYRHTAAHPGTHTMRYWQRRTACAIV
jgi:hypothetical protein